MIQLDDQYRIDADSYNFILQKQQFSKKGKKTTWAVIGYYPNIEFLLKAYCKAKLLATPSQDVKELLTALSGLYDAVEALGERLKTPTCRKKDCYLKQM